MTDSDSSSGLAPTAPHSSPAPGQSFWSDLGSNLRSGARAAVFLPVRQTDLRPAPGQLIALVVVGLGLQLLFAVLREGWAGQVDFEALPRALLYVPLLLLCGWAIAWREG